jgi:spore coat protein CotH
MIYSAVKQADAQLEINNFSLPKIIVTSMCLNMSAFDWDELRAAYWQDSHRDYVKECRSRAQGHRNRLTVELRTRDAA